MSRENFLVCEKVAGINLCDRFFQVRLELLVVFEIHGDGFAQDGLAINAEISGDLIDSGDGCFRCFEGDGLGAHGMRILLQRCDRKTFWLVEVELGDVVKDHEEHEENDADEGDLVDGLLELLVDVAAHDAFDEEEEDHAAVE